MNLYRIERVKGEPNLTIGQSHEPPAGATGEWVMYFAADNHALAYGKGCWVVAERTADWRDTLEAAIAPLVDAENRRHEHEMQKLLALAAPAQA